MPDTTKQPRRNRNGFCRTVFLPTYRTDKLELVDWEAFVRLGIRLVAVDLDNTLECHGSDSPDAYAGRVVRRMQDAGLDVRLYSNAANGRDERYAAQLGIAAIPDVRKPNPAALAGVMQTLGLTAADVLVIGDQLITDVWSANRLGARSLWVEKRDRKELLTIRVKRLAEALILRLNRAYFAGLPEVPTVSVYTPRQIP